MNVSEHFGKSSMHRYCFLLSWVI